MGYILYNKKNATKLNLSLINIHLCALFHAHYIKSMVLTASLSQLLMTLKWLKLMASKFPFTKVQFMAVLCRLLVVILVYMEFLGSKPGIVVVSVSLRRANFRLCEDVRIRTVKMTIDVIVQTKDMHAEHCHTVQKKDIYFTYMVWNIHVC